MPLLPGKENIGANISELTHHGSRPRNHDQIVAIALANADRHPHHAFGGGIGAPHAVKMLPQMKMPGSGGAGGAGGGLKPMSPSQGTPFWTRSAAREMDQPVKVKFAKGGGIGSEHMDVGGMSMSQDSPWWERSDSTIADQPFHSGIISGSTGGRTDRIPLAVGSNSHVLPADAVSGAGGGGSQSGSETWAAAIRGAPWGVPLPHEVRGHGPPAAPHVQDGFAHGGDPHDRTSILAAAEEVVVGPEDVEALGRRGLQHGMGRRGESAMDLGHRLIDEAIKRVREYNIKWLRNAPLPKK